MGRGRDLLLSGSLFLFFFAFASEQSFVVVRQGDTLSSIAGRFFMAPVYSDYGIYKAGLKQILELNPGLNEKSILRVGQKIRISATEKITSSENIVARAPAVSSQATVTYTSGNSGKVYQVKSVSSESPPQPQPPKVAKVAVEEAISAPVEYRGYTRLEIAPLISFFEMSAKDTLSGADASVLSEASPGIRGRWSQTWSDKLQTFIGGAYTQVSLQPAEGLNNFTLDKGSLLSAEMGVVYALKKVDVEASFFYRESLFPRATALNQIQIEAAPVMGLSARVKKEILKNANMSLGLVPMLSYLMGSSTSNYTIQSGYSLGAALVFRQQLLNPLYQMNSSISYEYEKQSTSLVDQTRNILTFSLGASFKFE